MLKDVSEQAEGEENVCIVATPQNDGEQVEGAAVRLFKDGALTRLMHETSGVRGLLALRDGGFVVLTHDGRARRWTHEGEFVMDLPKSGGAVGHGPPPAPAMCACELHSGEIVIGYGDAHGTIQVLAPTGELIQRLTHTDTCVCVLKRSACVHCVACIRVSTS